MSQAFFGSWNQIVTQCLTEAQKPPPTPEPTLTLRLRKKEKEEIKRKKYSIALNSPSALLRITYEATTEEQENNGATFLLILDYSGSMNPYFDIMSKTCLSLKTQLANIGFDTSNVGVVPFSSSAAIHNLSEFVNAYTIQGGGTNFTNAFRYGNEFLSNVCGEIIVIFMTDGQPDNQSYIDQLEIMKDKLGINGKIWPFGFDRFANLANLNRIAHNHPITHIPVPSAGGLVDIIFNSFARVKSIKTLKKTVTIDGMDITLQFTLKGDKWVAFHFLDKQPNEIAIEVEGVKEIHTSADIQMDNLANIDTASFLIETNSDHILDPEAMNQMLTEIKKNSVLSNVNAQIKKLEEQIARIAQMGKKISNKAVVEEDEELEEELKEALTDARKLFFDLGTEIANQSMFGSQARTKRRAATKLVKAANAQGIDNNLRKFEDFVKRVRPIRAIHVKVQYNDVSIVNSAYHTECEVSESPIEGSVAIPLFTSDTDLSNENEVVGIISGLILCGTPLVPKFRVRDVLINLYVCVRSKLSLSVASGLIPYLRYYLNKKINIDKNGNQEVHYLHLLNVWTPTKTTRRIDALVAGQRLEVPVPSDPIFVNNIAEVMFTLGMIDQNTVQTLNMLAKFESVRTQLNKNQVQKASLKTDLQNAIQRATRSTFTMPTIGQILLDLKTMKYTKIIRNAVKALVDQSLINNDTILQSIVTTCSGYSMEEFGGYSLLSIIQALTEFYTIEGVVDVSTDITNTFFREITSREKYENLQPEQLIELILFLFNNKYEIEALQLYKFYNDKKYTLGKIDEDLLRKLLIELIVVLFDNEFETEALKLYKFYNDHNYPIEMIVKRALKRKSKITLDLIQKDHGSTIIETVSLSMRKPGIHIGRCTRVANQYFAFLLSRHEKLRELIENKIKECDSFRILRADEHIIIIYNNGSKNIMTDVPSEVMQVIDGKVEKGKNFTIKRENENITIIYDNGNRIYVTDAPPEIDQNHFLSVFSLQSILLTVKTGRNSKTGRNLPEGTEVPSSQTVKNYLNRRSTVGLPSMFAKIY
jgi:hypothetical protein